MVRNDVPAATSRVSAPKRGEPLTSVARDQLLVGVRPIDDIAIADQRDRSAVPQWIALVVGEIRKVGRKQFNAMQPNEGASCSLDLDGSHLRIATLPRLRIFLNGRAVI